MSTPFPFLILSLMHILCTLNHRLRKSFPSPGTKKKERKMSKRTRDGGDGDKDQSENGSLIGGSHRPASCPSPCLFLSILPSSLPPSAGNRALSWRGGDDEIRRKLHRVLLCDKTREVGSLGKLQTTFEKTGSGRRETGRTRAGKTHTEREEDRKSHMGFEVMGDEGREAEREVN